MPHRIPQAVPIPEFNLLGDMRFMSYDLCLGVSGSFSVEDKSEEEVLEPAINIGAQFQAAIPHLRSASVNDTKSCGSVETLKDRAVLLWSPSTCKSFSQNER